MGFADWLRRGSGAARDVPARRIPAPRAAPSGGAPGLPPQSLSLDASDLAAAWRASDRRLVVAWPRLLDPERPVEVRITSRATGLDVALQGTAALVRSGQAPGGAGLAVIDPGAEGAALVARLVARSTGGASPVRTREPRRRISLPVVVTSEWGKFFMTTISAGRGGCGLAWSGPPPRLHGVLQLRLGAGRDAANLRGLVRWVSTSPRPQVGVRFLGGDDQAWARLLEELRDEPEAA